MRSRKDSKYVVDVIQNGVFDVECTIFRTTRTIGIVRSGVLSFFVDTEGIYTWVPIEFGGEIHSPLGECEDQKDPENSPVKFEFVPRRQASYSGKDDHPGSFTEQKELKSFIRSFGHRLEANYNSLVNFLDAIGKFKEDDIDALRFICERKIKIDDAVHKMLVDTIGFTPHDSDTVFKYLKKVLRRSGDLPLAYPNWPPTQKVVKEAKEKLKNENNHSN